MIDLDPGVIIILMTGLLLAFLLMGYPLGFVCAGVALIIGFLVWGPRVFNILYSQAWGILMSYILIAVPLFVFMGLMIERAGVAKDLFDSLDMLLHRVPGRLAVVVVLTGTILAACVGIISASIVMLGLVALPHMINRGYSKELATGAICAGGSLGILIPPSILLVIYGPMAKISVGKLFMGAVVPGLVLSGLYVAYIVIACRINPNLAPAAHDEVEVKWGRKIRLLLTSVFPIAAIILSVLGSIFFGVAAPTEAAAIGAFAATLLTLAHRRLTWSKLKEVAIGTGKVAGMIAVVAIGAMAYTGVFLALGGGEVVTNLILAAPGGRWGMLAIIMVIVFILGMFIADIGILFIVVPLVTPIAEVLGFHAVWFAIMINVNLQMSFLTPPLALAIYFLRGVIPDEYGINTNHIIRGVIPFIALIWVGLGLMIAFPQIILWLPSVMIR